MPFLSDKIKIKNTLFDRRVKLTQETKKEISEFVGLSIGELAKRYGVSRRTIQFIKYPERLERVKKQRLERGGSKIYYDKEKNTIYARKHRNYKHDLFLKNKISLGA